MVDTRYINTLICSGMVLSPMDCITNYHVESSTSVSITMADTNERYSATVLGRDASRDIAVLQIDTDEFLEAASSTRAKSASAIPWPGSATPEDRAI